MQSNRVIVAHTMHVSIMNGRNYLSCTSNVLVATGRAVCGIQCSSLSSTRGPVFVQDHCPAQEPSLKAMMSTPAY